MNVKKEWKGIEKALGILLFFLLLVGCGSGGLSEPEGEELTHEEAQDIIQRSIEGEQETSSAQVEVTQTVKAEFGGFFGLFTDQEEVRSEHLIVSQLPEDVYVHSRVYDSTVQYANEQTSNEPTNEVEIIVVDGNQYRELNRDGWQDLGEYEPEEGENLDEEYDYFDALLNMTDSQYQIVEQENQYVVFVEATNSQQAEQLESLLYGAEEEGNDRVQTFLEYGLDYFAFQFEIDKETLLPTSFEIAMSGGGTVDRERVNWEQILTGTYSNYNETFAIESPFTPGFDRPVVVEEVEPEEDSEEDNEEETVLETEEEESVDPNAVVIGLVEEETMSEEEQIERFKETEQHWIEAIEESTGTTVEFEMHGEDYQMLNGISMNRGNVDIGIVDPEVYIEISGGQAQFEPLVANIFAMQIVAREDTEINSIEDLEGMNIAVADPESLSGYISMRYHLIQEYGVDIEEIAEIHEMGSNDIVASSISYSESTIEAAIIPSFFTEVDLMEMEPIVLEEMEAPVRVLVTGPNFPNERREQVIEALYPEHGFLIIEDSDFDELRNAVEFFDIEFEW